MSGGSDSKPAPKPTPKRSSMTQSSSSRGANKYMLAVEAISTAYL